MKSGKTAQSLVLLTILALAWACADDPATSGRTEEFVSADEDYILDGGTYRPSGEVNFDNSDMDMDTDAGADADADSDSDSDADWEVDEETGEVLNDSVIEGDLYRVFSNGILLNLNSYRGLQVVDVSDPQFPTILGRYPLRGTPVEMYAYDNIAVVLFNNWQGYRHGVDGLDVEQFYGGLVVTVDLSNPSAPALISQEVVNGAIQTSRMVQGGNRQALYLAAMSTDGTLVQSFSIDNAGVLAPASELSLDGNITDITATATTLLVSGVNDSWTQSVVSLIDISDVDGQMVAASQVTTAGMVQKKSDMSLNGNILRIVSGRSGSSNLNHLQTWNVSDMTAPIAVDHDTFGESEDLYATLFLGNSAFFVTFMQTDPFHAFEIDDSGVATEHTEYIISGWNDFFKPAFGQSRIVGIGMGDSGLAVSLYDTALDNDSPFIARAELGADVWGSEATWDDRAFTVLDNAVSVLNAESVEETGLVLLPYSYWNETSFTYESGVQILTFSPDTLTLRGTMTNADMVRRSFLTADDNVANMSEEELNLFDFSDPDVPTMLGSVELAPWYSGYFPMGRHSVRVKSRPNLFSRYMYCEEKTGIDPMVASGALETISSAQGPDTAEVLATVQISPYAQVLFKEQLAVVISPLESCNNTWKIDTYDFSDPLTPALLGSISGELDNYEHYYGGGSYLDACYGSDCLKNSGISNARLVGNALVIPTTQGQRETLETKQYCETSGNYDHYTEIETENGWESTYYSGSILCVIEDDGTETCSGNIQQCVEGYNYETDDWYYNCEDVELNPVDQITTCWFEAKERYWESYEFDLVDISEPAAPVLLPRIVMPSEQQAAGLVVDKNQLLVNYKIPHEVQGDGKPYVKYFVTFINLSNPSEPTVSSAVNIPGAVFAVRGDTYVTRDPVYTDDRIDTTLNTVSINNGVAERIGTRKFENQLVQNMVVDDAGRAFVTLSTGGSDVDVAYDCAYIMVDSSDGYYGSYYGDYCYSTGVNTLEILDMSDPTLAALGNLDLNAWSSLQMVQNNRALLSVPGGMLIVDVTNAAMPQAKAFYPAQGWDHTFTAIGDTAVVTAGQYGIYRFDLSQDNLLE